MHRIYILPRLAFQSIKKSAASYLPYLLATSFAVFVFFIFSAIAGNEMMRSMPHAGYLAMLMQIGKVLLGIILVPFLFYTNSFLMKRRKRELGLYSILGLEKRHIGCIIGAETIMVYLVSVLLGIVMALVSSKLIFLLLLNITKLPIDVAFTAAPSCYIVTFLFFGAIFFLNLFINLIQVSRAKPADLFLSARQGEKQPKHLWPATLLGLATLGGGYYLALTFKLDSSFMLVFFAAILLVILGTYFLFTSGVIAFLRILKKNQRYYYHKKNFVTLSGMLYRMRKNAASLSNICIFSTMVIITLVCTVSLFKGMESIGDYQYPYDMELGFVNQDFSQKEELQAKIESKAKENNVSIADLVDFEYTTALLERKDTTSFFPPDSISDYSQVYTVRVLTLEDYNRIENTQETLADGEILFFSTGMDWGYNHISIAKNDYQIKQEVSSLRFETKEPRSFNDIYYLIVQDKAEQMSLYQANEQEKDQWIYTVRFNLDGEKLDQRSFVASIGEWATPTTGFSWYDSRVEGEQEDAAVLGGLLFLGIFFGIIFMVCMIMIMYYKQLSEGFEDKTNFDVMQQVGMSHTEVKATIRRQILIVFFLPLFMTFLHIYMALGPIQVLLGTLMMFDHHLILASTIGVSVVFTIIYILSYYITAKAYYRIVRR